MFELDLVHTLAFAGVALLLGHGLRRLVPLLERYNLPAPVLGGLVIAVAVLIARGQGVTLVKFDTTLQSPMMIAFFTTIGFGASLSLLKIGRPAGASLLPARDRLCSPSERRRHPDCARLRASSAVWRAGRIRDADGRAGDRARIRAALRTGRRGRRIVCRDRRCDRRHRRGWPGRRTGEHRPDRTRKAQVAARSAQQPMPWSHRPAPIRIPR